MPTFVEPPESSGSGYSEGDDPSFGTITATSKVSLPAGSNSAPSITNSSDTDTGIYFPAADNVGITADGTQIVDVRTTGVNITGNINVTGRITGDTSLTLDSTTLTTAELGVLDGVTAGDAAGGKALVLDSNKDLNDSNEVIRALRINSFGVGTSPTLITGDITYSAALKAPAGSNSAPSIAYSSDTDTGFYFGSAKVAVTVSGTEEVSVGTNGMQLISSLGVGTSPSGTTGEILATNNITAFSSDKRLKETIVPIQDPLSKLSTISGYTYRWNIDKCNQVGFKPVDIPEVGVLAQEINEVLPEAIKPAPFDRDKDGNSVSGDNYLTVQYEKIVPLLIECIKAQQTQIDELKVCLSKLK